jgi:hypothetical protein
MCYTFQRKKVLLWRKKKGFARKRGPPLIPLLRGKTKRSIFIANARNH